MTLDKVIAFKHKYGYLPEGRYPCPDCRCSPKDLCPGMSHDEYADWVRELRKGL